YSVYISSDHGNVESTGIGRPAEGVEAELKGQRVRIFDNINSREKVRKLFPNTIEWPPIGLPKTACRFLPVEEPHLDRREKVL
ncbi:MAG: BREX-3 system phosphatase PglZ, partial [Pseudomonadota bacterium]